MKVMTAKTFWTVVVSFSLTAILPVSAYYGCKQLLTRIITRDNASVVFEQFQQSLDQDHLVIHDSYTATSVAELAYRKKEGCALVDGWANPMRISATVQGDTCNLSVISAGPDGAFGTSDDLPMQQQFTLANPKATAR